MRRKKTESDKLRLLFGPYKAPPLKVGDRENCLARDCLVRVTGWTDAPVPWPRGVPVGGTGQPSVLVDEGLARAVRRESALAVMHHFGVCAHVASRWRKALGVTRSNNQGTRRLRARVLARIVAPALWAAGEVALLGTDYDGAVAGRLGRTKGAVRKKRRGLGVERFRPG
jgi:hypothetical protein